jgi:hypothetical protein
MLKQDFEDIILWSDDTWCYRYELSEMNYMSDDYFVLQFASTDWIKLLEKECPEGYDN